MNPGVAAGLGYENGATIAANFVRAGYDLVVFEYCFEEHGHVSVSSTRTPRRRRFLFTLWAPLRGGRARERARAGRRRSASASPPAKGESVAGSDAWRGEGGGARTPSSSWSTSDSGRSSSSVSRSAA